MELNFLETILFSQVEKHVQRFKCKFLNILYHRATVFLRKINNFLFTVCLQLLKSICFIEA